MRSRANSACSIEIVNVVTLAPRIAARIASSPHPVPISSSRVPSLVGSRDQAGKSWNALAPELSSGLAEEARRLALRVSARLDGLLQGEHLGHLPGPGTEPAEARAYTPGDDVRRIDWAVTARTQAPHVRQSVAERELETTLLVDLTPSQPTGAASG